METTNDWKASSLYFQTFSSTFFMSACAFNAESEDLCKKGADAELAHIIGQRGDSDITDDLYAAALSGNTRSFAKEIVRYSSERNKKPILQAAIASNNFDIFHIIITSIPQKEWSIQDHTPPIIVAAQCKRTLMLAEMIRRGSNYLETDKQGLDALTVSVIENFEPGVAILLSAGFTLDRVDSSTRSRIFTIAKDRNMTELISILNNSNRDIEH